MSATTWLLPGGPTSYPITRNAAGHLAADQEVAVDLAALAGANVLALHDGLITYAGWDGDCGYALDLEYDDAQGHWRWRYCHSADLYVGYGTWVSAGQPIGSVGSTGLSSGPHVHLACWINGVRVDPEPYLTLLGPVAPITPPTGGPGAAPGVAHPALILGGVVVLLGAALWLMES